MSILLMVGLKKSKQTTLSHTNTISNYTKNEFVNVNNTHSCLPHHTITAQQQKNQTNKSGLPYFVFVNKGKNCVAILLLSV